MRKGRYYKDSLGIAKAASSVIGCLAVLMGFIFKSEQTDLVESNTKLNGTTLICTVQSSCPLSISRDWQNWFGSCSSFPNAADGLYFKKMCNQKQIQQ